MFIYFIESRAGRKQVPGEVGQGSQKQLPLIQDNTGYLGPPHLPQVSPRLAYTVYKLDKAHTLAAITISHFCSGV